MSDGFKDKSGRLTAYALACGYIELVESGSKRVKLGRHGGGQRIDPYYVQLNDESQLMTSNRGIVYYDQFQTLAQARKAWRKLVKSI